MKNLYEKSKIRFALTWIISYVIGASCTDELSRLVNMEKSITVIFLAIMTAVALLWMKKNDLFREFGLCRAEISPKRLLFYIPLIVIASCNLWFGVQFFNEWAAPTPFDARNGFYNDWYHWTIRFWNSFTENAVVLLMD